MVQPRRVFAWLLVCVLACMFVLSMESPKLRDAWPRHTSESDRALTVKRVSASIEEIGKNHPPIVGKDTSTEEDVSNNQATVASDGENGPSPIVFSAPSIPPAAVAAGPHPNPLPEGEGTVAMDPLAEGEGTVAVDSLADGEGTVAVDSLLEGTVAVADENPQPVTPAGKIGTQIAETPEETKARQTPDSTSSELPELIRRLPAVVANLPSAIHAVPRHDVRPSQTPYPATDQLQILSKTPSPERERAERNADDSWREPETLLKSLNSLTAAGGATRKWAAEVIRQVRALGPAVASGSRESTAILERLAELNRQAPQLAARISDRSLARKLRKTGYALGRRLDVWQKVAPLGVPQPVDTTAPDVDPQKLALCLAEIDSLTGDSPEGKAWRQYLLVDALRDSSQRQAAAEDREMRRTAQQVLARLAETPLTPHQQKFVASGPMAALRSELRRWAAEPVGATAVLGDIETYERTGMPSDAQRLAKDCQNLAFSSIEGRRQLADRVDLHYRNANVRIAMTEELLNRLIPERNLEYAPVDETVLARPVWGESLMATEVAVRMLPDPHRVRLVLEVTGKIAAQTTADAGPVRFHNDSDSYYIARKPLEIDMNGISTWSTEIGVENETRLREVETPWDPIPLLGAGARWVAKSQLQQNQDAAAREVKQKVAAQARERIDAEARERLTQIVANMNQRVFDPLNALSLDPQMIDAETTEKRFTMRLRLAGEDQLGSHTPRPQAPANSLASMQIHESVLNNGIQRLQLNGCKFTLPELSKHIASRLSRPAPWEINPEHADVKIAFAKKDAIVVRCQDGHVILTLSIAQLSKSPRKWKNFQIRAFYQPKVQGRSAELVRDGVIQISGPRVNLGSRMALCGIFSHALSKNNTWELVPERIVKEPKLANTAITQFVIDDGWIAVAMGPKPRAGTMAKRPRWGTR